MREQDVVAAILSIKPREGKDRYMTCLRAPDDEYPNLWEFPGGKVEKGESHVAALTREIKEELCLTLISVAQQPLANQVMQLGDTVYTCYFYEVTAAGYRTPKLNVHADIIWLPLTVLGHLTNLTPGTTACVRVLTGQAMFREYNSTIGDLRA